MTDRFETGTARLTIPEFQALAAESLPIFVAWNMEVLAIGHGTATLRLGHDDGFLRPGGTIGGPIQMGLADVAMFAALLGAIGPIAGAVTSNLSINFLRKPPPAGLRAEARLLKLGRRLAVGEVAIHGEADDAMVAHVVATYAIPA
jgi:uncharacterized protein (TIGR00369 family)